MIFQDFAAERGLSIRELIRGRWVRVPTVDKPRKRNGAYFFDGDFGHVQNWATMDKCETWMPDRAEKPDPSMLARMEASRRAYAQEQAKTNADAAALADKLLREAATDIHPYLASKGFPGVKGRVDIGGRLLIRMEDVTTRKTVGLQAIEADGEGWSKKMLKGMRAKGAVYRLGSSRDAETWLVEGFATGLSVDAALRSLCVSAGVLVTFSAGNLVYVADKVRGRRFVYADNDVSRAGQEAAEKTGLPWCMSDTVGEDANDEHQRARIFSVRTRIQRLRSM